MFRWAILGFSMPVFVVATTQFTIVFARVVGFWWFKRAGRSYWLD